MIAFPFFLFGRQSGIEHAARGERRVIDSRQLMIVVVFFLLPAASSNSACCVGNNFFIGNQRVYCDMEATFFFSLSRCIGSEKEEKEEKEEKVQSKRGG
jgi:hypothetical protein